MSPSGNFTKEVQVLLRFSLMVIDMLHGAIKQFQQEHKTVPDDVSVITYSTYSLPFFNLIGMDPTRIQDDMTALGEAAVKLLNDIADNGATRRNIILQPDFVIGNTVKKL